MKRLQRRREWGVIPARWDVFKWNPFDRTFFVCTRPSDACLVLHATKLQHSRISAENREPRSPSFTVPRPCLFSSIPSTSILYISLNCCFCCLLWRSWPDYSWRSWFLYTSLEGNYFKGITGTLGRCNCIAVIS